MEHGLVRIPSPALAVGRIGTEHVIVGEEVFVAEILGGLSVVSDYFRVGAYLRLWESHTYLHTQPPFRNTSRIHAKEWSTQQCILEVNRVPAISTPQALSLRTSVSSSLGYSKGLVFLVLILAQYSLTILGSSSTRRSCDGRARIPPPAA